MAVPIIAKKLMGRGPEWLHELVETTLESGAPGRIWAWLYEGSLGYHPFLARHPLILATCVALRQVPALAAMLLVGYANDCEDHPSWRTSEEFHPYRLEVIDGHYSDLVRWQDRLVVRVYHGIIESFVFDDRTDWSKAG